MKTLIINGSPRRSGDTMGLINALIPQIKGEYRLVNAYDFPASPCIDCRYCQTHEGCAIKDDMQGLYDDIRDADCIVIASPIYFSELTGRLLDLASRFQTFYCARRFRKIESIPKPKRGAVILVGGGDGNMKKPYETACTLLHHLNCPDIHPCVSSHNTDTRPAAEDAAALSGIDSIARFLYTAR